MSKGEPPGADRTDGSSRRFAVIAIIAVLTLTVALLAFFQRFLVMPKLIMVIMILFVAILTGKFKPLITDWFVFFAFIYLFDSLRGTIYILTCKLQLPVYTTYVLNLERKLFGSVPSVTLQNFLLRPDSAGNYSWLEKILTVFYGSHFIAFLLVGFLIWLYRPALFSRYKMSFYLLTGLGIFFYAVVPTVPPWMASQQFGLLPPLTRFNTILFNFAIPDISNGFDTNPIAAMPSLHAAFPIMCSLLLWKAFKWKSLPFHLYTFVILFTIIYTGDHYVMDAVAGMVLAVICFIIAARRPDDREAAAVAGISSASRMPISGSSISVKTKLLAGLAVLFVGVVLGSVNRTQFLLESNSYGLHVPRYVDFLKEDVQVRDSYLVQFYLADHYLAKRDYPKALGYLERSLSLARDSRERTDVRTRLAFCRHALGLKT
jgi:hypothetical protein